MARGINKVILIGNLGKEPEIKAMPNGSSVVNMTVATSESWKDKETGEQQERTEWHRVVAFNRLAEICAQYLTKGSKVYIEGSIRTKKWQDESGADRYTTAVVAKEMQMLDSKADSAGGHAQQAPQQAPQQSGRNNPNNTQQSTTAHQQAPAPQQPAPPFDNFDDDIPF